LREKIPAEVFVLQKNGTKRDERGRQAFCMRDRPKIKWYYQKNDINRKRRDKP